MPLLDLPRDIPYVDLAVPSEIRIASARPEDCDAVFALICALAEYERLTDHVAGSADDLRQELFCERPVIEAVVAWEGEQALGFALFFHNFSTFLTRRGLYLEDLFVVPEARGRGIGKSLIRHGARLAVRARLRALRVVCAGLEHAGHRVLRVDRCRRDAGLAHLPDDGDALTRFARPTAP